MVDSAIQIFFVLTVFLFVLSIIERAVSLRLWTCLFLCTVLLFLIHVFWNSIRYINVYQRIGSFIVMK